MKSTFMVVFLCLTFSNYSEAKRLINGTPASASEFPASIWVGGCSATVVGPQAVFLAAHCMQSGNIQFTVGGSSYQASCLISREYDSNPTADYAMCATERDIVGITYERINTNPSLISMGMTLLLSGYGCTQPGGSDQPDGVFRIGNSQVVQLPTGSSYDLVTRGGAALCYGDSGGAAFFVEGSGRRFVVGTNSRGDISTESLISATHTQEAIRFFGAWSQRTGRRICGIHSAVSGCRN